MKKSAFFPRLSRFCGRVSSPAFKERISSFLESEHFIALLASLALLGHIFTLDVPSMCLMLALASASLIFAMLGAANIHISNVG